MTLMPTTGALGVHVDQEAILRAFNLNPRDPKVQAMMLACEKYGLDPLLKHAVLISGNLYVTRDGLLHVAHRDGRLDGIVVDDEGQDETEWWAKVTVWVKGQSHGYTYRGRYPKDGQQKKYGPEMAVKVAEVMALRRAFGVTGIATAEEQWDKAVETTAQERPELVAGESSVVDVPSPPPVSPVASVRPTAPPATSPGGGQAHRDDAPSGSPVDGGEEQAVQVAPTDDASAPALPTVDDIETELLKVAGKTIPAAKRAALKHAAMHHGHSGSWDDLLADEAKARAVLADLSGEGTAPPAVPSDAGGPDSAQTTAPSPDAPLKEEDPKRYTAENKWCQAAMGRVGHADKDEREAQRDGLAWAVSGGRATSWAELTRAEFTCLRDLLAAVDDGRARIVETDDPAFLGWTVVYEREDVSA